MRNLKAIIFDMDGVLIDAREWHYEALNRALHHFGYVISRYDHLVTFDGLPTRMKLEMLSRDRDLPRGLHAFLNSLKQSYTTELVHARCKPVFQHEYALSRLKHLGYHLAVASNSVRRTIELMMERSCLAPFLDAVLSNEDVQKPKPDPEMYIAAAQQLGVQPGECLVVEDNPHGIAAARASGANVMVVREVMDVTFDNIQRHLNTFEAAFPGAATTGAR